ncbi:hypothetical protein PanWU01x14_286900 [Parasponia andersonii]|uniref:Uncharacterized protein n=1 Tax=Parasponia andersonii TaxID=3476 RepID=A0A2P5AZ12_PARAD|nr:hypothetical protein PanWU01x14_286900 [Parasponia andersonii]
MERQKAAFAVMTIKIAMQSVEIEGSIKVGGGWLQRQPVMVTRNDMARNWRYGSGNEGDVGGFMNN